MSITRVLLSIVAIVAVSIYLMVTDGPGIEPTAERAGSDTVMVHETDPAMNAAIEQARSSLAIFTGRLPSLRASGAFICIKLPLTEGGMTEHVWMADPAFDGGQFTGRLASEPVNLPSWSRDDRIAVSADQISDWMAIDGEVLYGGYTIHVLHDRMSPAEQRDMAQQMGVAIPDRPVVWN